MAKNRKPDEAEEEYPDNIDASPMYFEEKIRPFVEKRIPNMKDMKVFIKKYGFLPKIKHFPLFCIF